MEKNNEIKINNTGVNLMIFYVGSFMFIILLPVIIFFNYSNVSLPLFLFSSNSTCNTAYTCRGVEGNARNLGTV